MSPAQIQMMLYIIGLVFKYGPEIIDFISDFIESLAPGTEITLEMIQNLEIPEEDFIPIGTGPE